LSPSTLPGAAEIMRAMTADLRASSIERLEVAGNDSILPRPGRRSATKDDPLGLLFRIVLLRGAWRGEAVGPAVG
jgi:hypothetical protein